MPDADPAVLVRFAGNLAAGIVLRNLERNMQCHGHRMRNLAGLFITTMVLLAAGGCAHKQFFPGTTILRTTENQNIIAAIDEYRLRLSERNSDGLILLASESYREDSGTPRSDDDYGYEGLRQVLRSRLSRVKSIWYEIELRDIRVVNNRAEVDAFLNGSFELASESGDRYRRVNDYHRFVLAHEGEKWKFVSGM